jgi:hypothetical protein
MWAFDRGGYGYSDLLGLEIGMTSTLPFLHTAFLETLIEKLKQDDRFEALLAGGSMVHGGFDEHSDIDLVPVVRSDAYARVLHERREIAGGLGNLISAFTGEHVGEPRLLICLYGPELLHVDLKFVVLSDLITALFVCKILMSASIRSEYVTTAKDGNLITAGGVTSGIDFGLRVVVDIAGEAVAQGIQLSLEYDPDPPFASGHPDRAPDAVKAMHFSRYEHGHRLVHCTCLLLTQSGHRRPNLIGFENWPRP